MRKEGKHIDEVFREGLNDLNVTPPAGVWETVDKRISRRKLYFSPMVRLAAASVLLMMIIGSFWLIFLRKPLDRDLADQPVVSGNKTGVVTGNEQNQVVKTHNAETNPLKSKVSRENQQKLSNTLQRADKNTQSVSSASAVESRPVVSQPPVRQEFYAAGQVNVIPPKEETRVNSTLSPLVLKPGFVGSYADMSLRPSPDESDEASLFLASDAEKTPSQWIVGGSFGPFYSYRTLAAGDKFYAGYLNGQENGLMAYSGGLTVQYTKKQSRLTLQTGISYGRIGQVANDVIAFKSLKTGNFALLEAKGNDYIHVSEGRLAYDENPVFIANKMSPDGMEQESYLLNQVGAGLYETVDVTLKQDIGMIEIPLILRYRVTRGNGIGLNLLGGLGSSLLVSGKSLIQYGGEEILLGNTADLRTLNMNGILGLGMSYQISPAFRFSIEPMFKYYLNPVNRYSSVRAHPYSVGVYSGLSLAF